MKYFIKLFALILVAVSVVNAAEKPSVLVIRGGHPYESPAFENMCLALEGVTCELLLDAHFNSMKTETIVEKYDAILFLNQNKRYRLEDQNRKRYIDLAKNGIGMVFLQFTLASQPDWDEFHALVGGKYHLGKFQKDKALRSTYHPNSEVELKVLNAKHPVTKGLKDFTITDAFYGNLEIAADVTPLLGVEDPQLSPVAAWTHQYENAQVVYILPGYSNGAYGNEHYRKLVSNALKFVAE